MFVSEAILRACTWQAFERLIARAFIVAGFDGVRVVGGSGDKGADILAHKNGKRWLIQAKHWKKPVGHQVIQQTVSAAGHYRASVSVVIALNGYVSAAREYQQSVMSQGISVSLWTPSDLIDMVAKSKEPTGAINPKGAYQASAIDAICEAVLNGGTRKGMVVMATGLGKTFTAAEAVRRIRREMPIKALVVAHTNSLVEQLEKAFWPFLSNQDITYIWNQYERLTEAQLDEASFVFASRDTVANYCSSNEELDHFNLVIVDECHHAHCQSTAYQKIFNTTKAGSAAGPFLLGLTATPFLASESADLSPVFGDHPLISVDMLYGLKNGFLSKVDYRMHTDNINWEGLRDLKGNSLSPKAINRALFIREWDEAVVDELQKSWLLVSQPKAIVFCGTIRHAISMRDRINARGFCSASAIFSGEFQGEKMVQFDRSLLLCDFHQGDVDVICAVDIFNEGIDVPDVNIIVFNRVTHSRRIFVQQLGRGLRVSDNKEFALVLDFAQDIRRFAAGIKMKKELCDDTKEPLTVSIGNKIHFTRLGEEDKKAEGFLKAWLDEVESLEEADDNVGILKFPPALDKMID
jgi:superfamily II DNA or RNA helicase